jgi:hypothetical protein
MGRLMMKGQLADVDGAGMTLGVHFFAHEMAHV